MPEFPTNFDDYDQLYDLIEGGDNSQGWDVNPATGEPYTPQYVPRGDYGRILAEFWADGPDSETPPGHWFTIVNYVNDHPELEKRWNGQGEILPDLEWDVKTYFTLGGTMHDAAVAAWSVKGYYDYIRPVSAIRYMAEMGQSTDPGLPNYNPAGFPLVPGYIEQVQPGEELAGTGDVNAGEIKILAWRGPDYIIDDATDEAGVGWILAKDWWPYQRPSFVTPPFAGYVSGHSTYSRAAAECLTRITGDPYFPGGVGIFQAPQNEFLVFEDGPSIDIELQWATYRDASDQCSLSRIWGGIHPPADDIPGSQMGMYIGDKAFQKALSYFDPDLPRVSSVEPTVAVLNDDAAGNTFTLTANFDEAMDTNIDPEFSFLGNNPVPTSLNIMGLGWDDEDSFTWTFSSTDADETIFPVTVQIHSAQNVDGVEQLLYVSGEVFSVDTENPTATDVTLNSNAYADAEVGDGTLTVELNFSEAMMTDTDPTVGFNDAELNNSVVLDEMASMWMSETTYLAVFNLLDMNTAAVDADVEVAGVNDVNGNMMTPSVFTDMVNLDTENPTVMMLTPNTTVLNQANVGAKELDITVVFNEAMDQGSTPVLTFNESVAGSIVLNEGSSNWVGEDSYQFVFDIIDEDINLTAADCTVAGFLDGAGNNGMMEMVTDELFIDTAEPMVTSLGINEETITDSEAGAATLIIEVNFSEEMDAGMDPVINLIADSDISGSFTFNSTFSTWSGTELYNAVFDVTDENIEVDEIDVEVTNIMDLSNNPGVVSVSENQLLLDTKNPSILVLSANDYNVENNDVGEGNFNLIAVYDEPMGSTAPLVAFPDENPLTNALTPNLGASEWISENTYSIAYDVNSTIEDLPLIDVQFSNAEDIYGNPQETIVYSDYFSVLLDSTVTVAEMLLNNNMYLFPNPVQSGQPISLFTGTWQGDATLKVVSINGQTVWESRVESNGQETVAIPTTGLAAGLYFAVIGDQTSNTVLRFEVN
ncbi:MAG: T9SS type A sorting domain-containing protein [Flavobacteriales bacterium]|nr:T9SS type A sorting domain-containing protein [Flavobacteriales bacterium]